MVRSTDMDGYAASSAERAVVIGFGWVGQATALALKLMGVEVSYFDPASTALHYVDEYEARYREIPRLTDVLEVDSPTTWYLVCVGDRVSDEGVQDIHAIRAALESLRNAKGGVILRSTILPEALETLPFDIYLPEFLHEKTAVAECLNPHFFVAGINASRKPPAFLSLWRARAYKVFHGTPREASLVKYLSNIWNAVRIAFVNEIGDTIGEPSSREHLQEIDRVLDFVLERGSYLRYGRSFGGHCLPKDLRAFVRSVKDRGGNAALMEGAYRSNDAHAIVEKTHAILPEWYSPWETRRHSLTGITSYVKKRILDAVERLIPPRALSDRAREWTARASENPLYYSYTKVPSGKGVEEAEFEKTGEEDYRRLLAEDIILAERAPAGVALDFGSGAGRLTGHFANNFTEVYAIDIAEPMLAAAARRLPSQKNISYLRTDGTSIPLEDNKVDLVFSYLTLKHVPTHAEMQQLLAEMRRVLAPGGIAKIHFHSGAGMRRWHYTHGVSLMPRDAERLAEAVGFSILREAADEHGLWLWLTK